MKASFQEIHASVSSIRTARQTWQQRATLRVFLTHKGFGGIGEAAPLRGFSKETIVQAREALKAFEWPAYVPSSVEEIASIGRTVDENLPSVRMAVEGALLSLLASSMQEPLWSLLTDQMARPVPIARVLWANNDNELLADARQASGLGARAAKIKVGPDLDARIAMIRDIKKALPHTKLRFDANGSFAGDGLLDRLNRLAAFDPQFVEEPASLEEMAALPELPFPLAVDESLAPTDDESVLDRLDRALEIDAIRYVVLKPTLLGGPLRALKLAKRAHDAGREVVFSHALEGAVARSLIAQIGMAFVGSERMLDPVEMGIGPHPALRPLSGGFTSRWIHWAYAEPPRSVGLGLELGF